MPDLIVHIGRVRYRLADLLSQLEALARSARKAIEAAADEKSLEDLRVRFLGKKGEISAIEREVALRFREGAASPDFSALY